MENQDAKNNIIEILQKAYSVKNDIFPKPVDVADAIINSVEFSSSYTENGNKNLYIQINALKLAAEEEYNQLGDLEINKLLRNFARGKIEAYEEILSILKK